MFKGCLLLLLIKSSFALASISQGTVTLISPTNVTNTIPQIAADPSGNAIAVWDAFIINQVQAARFNVTTGVWSPPITIGFNAAFPQIGIDSSGNAIALWVSTFTNQIFASRFNVTTLTWSTPIQISNGGIDSNPQIAVSNTGNAVAVWSNFPSVLQAATFSGATLTWSAPVIISNNGGFAEPATDQIGNGFIVWQNFSTGGILALRFPLP